jgi:hypothetical protein
MINTSLIVRCCNDPLNPSREICKNAPLNNRMPGTAGGQSPASASWLI